MDCRALTPRLSRPADPKVVRVAVIGPGDANEQLCRLAEQVGSALAEQVGSALAAEKALVVCGGRGGVMEAVARGARKGHGQVLGILPGLDPAEGNRYLTDRESTGLGEARNFLLVDRADAVIAVGCNAGTLTEAAYAFQQCKPIVSLNFWELIGPQGPISLTIPTDTAKAAVEQVLRALRKAPAT